MRWWFVVVRVVVVIVYLLMIISRVYKKKQKKKTYLGLKTHQRLEPLSIFVISVIVITVDDFGCWLSVVIVVVMVEGW